MTDFSAGERPGLINRAILEVKSTIMQKCLWLAQARTRNSPGLCAFLPLIPTLTSLHLFGSPQTQSGSEY